MSYDEALAERVRALLADVDVSEQRMFGGVAFLLDRHMALAASGQGGLLVRVDPADGERLVSGTGARPMVMRGRPLKGWLRLSSADVADPRALEAWVRRGVQYAAGLPSKG